MLLAHHKMKNKHCQMQCHSILTFIVQNEWVKIELLPKLCDNIQFNVSQIQKCDDALSDILKGFSGLLYF